MDRTVKDGKTYLKYREVLPILYPITILRSLVPSTSNNSITGPNLASTFHITWRGYELNATPAKRVHHLLVNVQSILRYFLQENGIGDRTDVGFPVYNNGLGWEVAFCHEVATKLLGGCGGNCTSWTERFQSICILCRWLVQELFIDSKNMRLVSTIK